MTLDRAYLDDLAVLVALEFTDTRTLHCCTDQGCDTADHVNCAGTCEIMETKSREPASAPDPVCFDRVDHCGDHTGIDTVGEEFCTLCHGTGNDGCGGGAEYHVEHEIGPVKILIIRKNAHRRQSDKAAERILTEQKSEAEEHENHGTDAEIHQVFHDDITGVFRSCEAGFDHRKACLHEENQCRADQEPDTEYLGIYLRE